MAHCKPISTLTTFGTKLTQLMSPQTPQEIATMSTIPYANVVGSFIHATTSTKLDIAFAMNYRA